MRVQQLTLPFPLCDDDKTKMLTEAAKAVLTRDFSQDYAGVKKVKKVAREVDHVEWHFPQYKRAYHAQWVSGYGGGKHPASGYRTVLDSLGEKSPQIPKGITRIIETHNSAHSPAYLNLTVDENKRVVCDYGFHVYARETDNGGSVDHDKVMLSAFLHTEYSWNQYDMRHTVDKENSWIALDTPVYGNPTYIATLDEVKDLLKQTTLIFPWSHIWTLDSSAVGNWKNELKQKIKEFCAKNLIVYTIGDKQADASRFLDTWGSYNGGEALVTLYSEMMNGADFKEVAANMIRNALNQPNVKIFPSFYPFALRHVYSILEIATQERRAGGQINMQQCITNLTAYLGLVAWLCHHYDDATLIKIVPELTYEEGGDTPVWSMYNWPISQVKTSIVHLLDNPLFQAFPRAKQYRILASIFEEPEGMTNTRDLINMLVDISQRKVDLREKLDTDDIKNIKHFHDETVKVYNAIKNAPKPLPEEQTQWLVDYGLEVKDSTFEIRIPEDTNVIRTWGQLQSHCIGSYADQAANGSTILLGVWDTNKNDWFGHLQISPVGPVKITDPYYRDRGNTNTNWELRVSQFYGKRNCALDAATKEVVLNHLRSGIAQWKEKLEQEAAEKAAEKQEKKEAIAHGI